MSKKKLGILAAIVIILFAIGLRFNAPTADLPSHITFSGSILTDEGNQCHNSRSKALYDDWYPDDWRITNYNPVLPYIKLASFKLFGVGILPMRLFSHVFAALSLLFFFLILNSYFKDKIQWALLGTFLLGINFLYVMYNKIGTFETSITFWVILTLYFLEKYRVKGKPLFLALSGAAAFMGFIFKSIMAYLLPLPFAALVLMYLFSRKQERTPVTAGSASPTTPEGSGTAAGSRFPWQRILRDMLFILGGVLVLCLPWYIFHYMPNKEWIISAPGQFMGNLMFPKGLESAVHNFLTFPWKDQFYKIPVVWVCSLIFLPVFFRRLLKRQATLLENAAVLFFFAHTFLFFIMSYRPTRYFVPLIPVMVLMTVLLLERWAASTASGSRDSAHSSTTGSGPGAEAELGTGPEMGIIGKLSIFGIDTLWLTVAAYFCFLPLAGRIIPGIPRPPLSLLYLLVSALLVAAAYFTKPLLRKSPVQNPSKLNDKKTFAFMVKPVIGILLLISLLVNLGYYWQWHRTKTFKIRDMSVEMGKELKDAYIGGMTSTVAVLENKHRALWLYPNFVNWDNETFKKYPMTHALLGTDVSREVVHFFNQWPGRMAGAELLKVYPIKDYFLHLYSFQNPYITHAEELAKAPDLPVKTSASAQPDEAEQGPVYRLTVLNPSPRPIDVRVGTLIISPADPGPVQHKSKPNVHKPTFHKPTFQLKPGENELMVPVKELFPSPRQDAGACLFFLDYQRPFNENKRHLRYEAENLDARTGINKAVAGASDGHIRYFDPTEHKPGFLAYGPAVPFAPGVMVVEFKLSFNNIKTKLRALCSLDIYSKEDKRSLVQRTVKLSDFKNAPQTQTGNIPYASISLVVQLPATRTLEFRLKAEPLADISFDCIDVTYYQGYPVNF